MSTNVNAVDNRNINETALDCGVDPSDVENYTNDESININQDNSQNIVVSGDGNTLENISQKMNLTSYGPEVQKCMQDAVNKMAQKSATSLSSDKSNSTSAQSASQNKSGSSSKNASSSSNDISNSQRNAVSHSSSQSADQSASVSQATGMSAAGGSGGSEILIIVIITVSVMFVMNKEKANELITVIKNEIVNNKILQLILISYLICCFIN
jgi:cobalamin biosynthesis Mg chelatase CobN